MKLKRAIYILVMLLPCLACLAWPAGRAGAEGTSADPNAFTLKDRGYDVTTVRGLVASAEFFLPGPGAVELSTTSAIRLHFSYSGALAISKSSFSVRLNDHDMLGAALDPSKGSDQWLDVPLPPSLVSPDFNTLQVIFNMRRETGDQVCSDPYDPLLWATIFPDTAINYVVSGPMQFNDSLDLGSYPAPIYRSAFGPDPQVQVVLPRDPSAIVMTAASSMLARLGQASVGRTLHPVLHNASLDGLPAQAAVAIGAGKDFAWLGQQSLPLPYNAASGSFLDAQGKPLPADTGVLELFERTQDGKAVAPMLLVSGGSDEGVWRAALTLASSSYSELLHGSYAIITQRPDVQTLSISGVTPGVRTFGSLTSTSSDPTVHGRGRQSVSVSFFVPQNYTFNTQPQVTVHFSHADGLDDRSLLTVEVNGTAVGSTRLDAKNATGGTLTLSVPPSVIHAGANSLSAIFDMRPINDIPCDSAFDDVAWGTIHHDSSLDLPFGDGSSRADLSSLGAPFVQAGAIRDTTVVIPPSPGPEVVSQTLTLAARLGTQTRSDMTYLPVVLSTNVAPLPPENLIVVGLPTGQPLMSALQASLPLQFNESGELEWLGKKASESSDAPVLLSVQDQQPVGILQMVSSPWQSGRTVLLVSGTSQQSVGWAVDAVTQGSLNGNLALISQDGHAATLTLQESRPPSVANLQESSPVWVAILAGVVAIILMVVTVILTATRLRASVPEGANE